MSSSTSTASAFSIFAITCACEPACSISARRSRTSAGERTNDSATKSTPSSSANSRSAVSFRVSDGIGSGTPGRLTPLCEVTTPADDRPRSCARPRSTVADAQADEAVVDQDVVARLRARRRSRPARPAARRRVQLSSGADGDRRRPCAARPARRARRCGASAPAGRRSARSAGPTSASTSRTRRARSACSSCVPCERLSRAASMPAATSARSFSGESEAGPSVATIFVRRSRSHEAQRSSVSASRCARGNASQPGIRRAPCRAAPRSGAAGCTSRRGRCAPARRS